MNSGEIGPRRSNPAPQRQCHHIDHRQPGWARHAVVRRCDCRVGAGGVKGALNGALNAPCLENGVAEKADVKLAMICGSLQRLCRESGGGHGSSVQPRIWNRGLFYLTHYRSYVLFRSHSANAQNRFIQKTNDR
ncbi:hypothetical protein [Salipiger aestuarii]|uniref:hypothetical protein n=1 Tax=Salipiger aestuarii TaxID=568098 RepID=UPI0011B93CF5|nr:hypothetical protein [Salipiger aestuarii]